ncbi:carbohydrate ABC transporter permease [Glycomyces albus]
MSTVLKPPAQQNDSESTGPRRPSNRSSGGSSAKILQPTVMTRIGLVGVIVLSIFPLYWMIVIASRTTSDASKFPPALLPGGNLGSNIERALNDPASRLIDGLVNSIIITGTVTVSVVLISTLAGFAFAKLHFRGARLMMGIVLATMMVPLQHLGLVPLYLIMVELEWLDTYQAAILPFLVNGFGIFLMRQYTLQSVPDELIEAARVDGASTLRIWWQIVLPALRPGMVVLGLLTFMLNWNEFLWPFLVLGTETPTIQMAIRQISIGLYTTDLSMVFTGTLISIIPIAILFVIFGRQIVSGIMEGSTKQ